MLSNAYFLAKFRFDTAENEPAKNLQNFAKKTLNLLTRPPRAASAASSEQSCRSRSSTFPRHLLRASFPRPPVGKLLFFLEFFVSSSSRREAYGTKSKTQKFVDAAENGSDDNWATSAANLAEGALGSVGRGLDCAEKST